MGIMLLPQHAPRCVAGEQRSITIGTVIRDGDTFVMRAGDRLQRIRLCGVDAPIGIIS